MHVTVLTFLVALGLISITFGAPHQNGAPRFDNSTCVADHTTVYVAIPGSVSTVYITRAASSSAIESLPTKTVTTVTTIHGTRTLTKSLSLAGTSTFATAKSDDQLSYDDAITEIAIYTVTKLYTEPAHTPTSVAAGASTPTDEVYQFYVENSTTIWVGATPSTVEPDAVIITSVVTIIPVDSPIADISSTRTSTQRISTTIYTTSTDTATKTSFSSMGTVFTGIASNGWNSTSNSPFVYGAIIGSTGGLTAVPIPGSKQSTFETDIPSIDIYQHTRLTISLSSYAAASGFQTNNPSYMKNATSINMPTRASRTWETSSAQVFGYLTSFVSPSLTEPVSSLVVTISSIVPPIVNITYDSSDVANSAQGVKPSSNTLDGIFVPLVVNTTTITGLGGVSSNSILAHASLTKLSDYTFVTSLLPSSTISLLPLGSVCNSTYQCSDGAECYATNSMLVTACGNFQASCSSDAQCAFNTCNEGFCNGPKPQPSFSASQNRTSTTSMSTIRTSAFITVPPSPLVSVMSSSTPPASCLPKGPSYGNFTVNFDDIPPLVVPSKEQSSIHAAPLFSPYHQFDFSDGFTVGPPPTDAYHPSSPPLLLEFTPFYSGLQVDSPDAEHHFTGQISSGDHASTGCFNFNFFGGSFGCNSTGPNCEFTFSGYRYDIVEKQDSVIHTQTSSITACPAQIDCVLVPVFLDEGFKNLTHVRINATVEGEPKSWWIDDLKLGWFDNSCEFGNCRLESHIRH